MQREIDEMESDRRRLLAAGGDPAKVNATVMFRHDAKVKASFNHKAYGCKHAFEKNKPTRWFRGGAGPLARARSFVAAVNRDRGERDPTFLFAHDFPVRRKGNELVVKVFCALTPWDFLKSLAPLEHDKRASAERIFRENKLPAPDTEDAEETGVALHPWPCSSLYTFRPEKYDHGDYAMTIDVDGKHMLSRDEIEAKAPAAATRVKDLFEKGGEGEPYLKSIGDALKELVRERFAYEGEAWVSWHASNGWKPSWRGYLVGPMFKNLGSAREFARKLYVPTLRARFPWFREGVVDDAVYSRNGHDRCLGSAKFELDQREEMRFLQPNPIVGLTDGQLCDLFAACPNEYVLVVTGLAYARNFDGAYLELAARPEGKRPRLEPARRKKHKREKRTREGAVAVAVVERLLAERDRAGETIRGGSARKFSWSGDVEKIEWKSSIKVEVLLRAAQHEHFCVFRLGGKRHQNGGKQMMRLTVNLLTRRVTLDQKCFSCSPYTYRTITDREDEDVAAAFDEEAVDGFDVFDAGRAPGASTPRNFEDFGLDISFV